MRLILLLTFLASPLLAGSYTITTTTQQDTRLNRAVARANRLTCVRYGLKVGCTQAQARNAYCQRSTGAPAPCTGSTQIDIHSDVAAFLQAETVRLVRDQWGPQGDQDAKAALLEEADKATAAKKDAACVALGLAAGCLP